MDLRKLPPSSLAKLLDPNFIFGRHLQVVEPLVLDMYEDAYDCLSIQMPIRHSKSLYACCIAFWLLCHNPDERIIIAAFSKDAASEMLVKVRDALQIYGDDINHVLIDDKHCRSDYFKIKGRLGECRAVSIGTKFSHATANTIICDDIYTEESARSVVQRQSIENWFFNTLLNRRTKCVRGQPKVITTMTPRHPEDVLSIIEKDSKWKVHRQPAINDKGEPLFPELWPLDKLLIKKEELESVGKLYAWQTVWMCDPSEDPMNSEFPARYFDDIWYEELPPNLPIKATCMALDPSKGADAKAGDYGALVLGHLDNEGRIWVQESYLERATIPMIVDRAVTWLEFYKPDCFAIECNGFQEEVATRIAEEAIRRGLINIPILKIISVGNSDVGKGKARIVVTLDPILSQKRLKFRDTPTNQRGIMQTRNFPSGDHDDYPDALEMLVQAFVRTCG